jgi:hypothetical protein
MIMFTVMLIYAIYSGKGVRKRQSLNIYINTYIYYKNEESSE